MQSILLTNNDIDFSCVESTNSSNLFAKLLMFWSVVSSSFVPVKIPTIQKEYLYNYPDEKIISAQESISAISGQQLLSQNDKSAEVFDYFDDAYKKCVSLLPFEDRITIESEDYLGQLLQFEKRTRPDQYRFLMEYFAFKQDVELLKAMLVFVSSLEYNEVTPEEEQIISIGLHTQDIVTQEIALNALLSIDNYSNKDSLRDVAINNKFLQRDLNTFLDS